MIYLTKKVEGKVHHFRVQVIENAVDVVHGIFYNWMGKYGLGCENHAAALAKQQEMVNEVLQQGYQVTTFEETLENNNDVYDRAAWHYNGNFPEDLDDFQASVHTGMFLSWLIETGLVSEQFKEDHADDIQLFMERQLTGAELFDQYCDGILMLEDVSETGNRFALRYYTEGPYLEDYENILGRDLPTLYHVADTWENYHLLKPAIDRRFEKWRYLHPHG